MKKITLLFSVLLPVFSLSAQFSINKQNYSYPSPIGVDYVFIINGIDTSTDITYMGAYSTINWYKFSAPNTSISNLDYISPDDATGYIVEIDGTIQKTIWVIDYQLYLPNLLEFEPDFDESTCEKTAFRLNLNAVPQMIYYSSENSTPHYINREFTVTYNSKEYAEGAWNVIEKTERITFPTPNVEIPTSLYPSAEFMLSGDQFATDFMLAPTSIKSNNTPTTAIKQKLTAFVNTRDALNEVERPKESEPTPPISGSAPIEISFESRPSDESAMFEWKIYRENELLVTRTDKDQRYTFTSQGKYKVTLLLDNGYCTDSASIEINVRESLLEVPNIFTPNNDGINDEFRVTYRSLESFHCWVYNNWGKKAYEWTDPAKGWNGRIGNKNAPSGTYFYIIKAKGTDGYIYNLKGDVSIMR